MGKTPIPFSPGPLLTFKAFPLGKVERFKKGKSGKGGKVASATWARADTCHQRRETVRRQEQKEQQRSRRLNTDIRITNLSSKALESKIKTKGRENVFQSNKNMICLYMCCSSSKNIRQCYRLLRSNVGSVWFERAWENSVSSDWIQGLIPC